MRITQAPRPDITIEPKGDLYQVVRKKKPEERVAGLTELVKDGTIALYNEQDDKVTIFARTREGAQRVAELPEVKKPNKFLEKAKEIFLPPDLDNTVAPEYLRFRAWDLGSSLAAGAVSFANISVGMNALKASFTTTEKAALAQTINTFVWRFSYMGGSFMSGYGEVDPRKFYTASNLIATTNSIASLSILSMLPKAFMPVSLTTSVLGAVGSTLGSSAGVNVFNHMAIKNKGVVQAKNSNQNLVAAMLGMPIALGLRNIAGRIGVNPALLTAGTMAPAMFFCGLKAASSIRMEPIRRGELEKLCDNFIQTGLIEAAPNQTPLEALTSLFSSRPETFTDKIVVADKLDQVLAGQDPQGLSAVYKNEKYLLSYTPETGTSTLGLRKDASLDDIFKGYTQGRLAEKLGPGLYPEVQKLVGESAPTVFVELLHRASEPPARCIRELNKQGWHANHLKLSFPTLNSEWTGPDLPVRPPVTIAELQELAAKPDAAKLKLLLGL